MLGFLSDTDDEEILDTSNAADVLALWGLAAHADDIPILLVPEPIAFLISQGRWTEVMILCSWHNLINADGHQLWQGRHLFAEVPWPPLEHQVWTRIGDHDQQADALDISELNAEDHGPFFKYAPAPIYTQRTIVYVCGNFEFT